MINYLYNHPFQLVFSLVLLILLFFTYDHYTGIRHHYKEFNKSSKKVVPKNTDKKNS
jgi:hypothetical protein